MKQLTGSILQKLHKAPYGPCRDVIGTAQVLQKAMDEFEIDTTQRVSNFLGQVCWESNEFSQLTEDGDGSRYEGRIDLGNVSPGDGPKFKGRGYLQTTGRHNYVMAGQALKLDLLNHPELLAVPENAARAAGFYWQSHGLNTWADVNDIVGITKKINGGFNGLDMRTYYTNIVTHLYMEGMD